MSSFNNRPRTQIDILKLAKASPPARAMADGTNKKRKVTSADASTVRDQIKKGITRSVNFTATGKTPLKATSQSPWDTYTKEYELDLGGAIDVSTRKAPSKLVHIRTFPTKAAEKPLHMFGQLRNNNIVNVLEAFITDNSLYIVLEYMHISLQQVVKCPAYLNERQLGAIIGQVSTCSQFCICYSNDIRY